MQVVKMVRLGFGDELSSVLSVKRLIAQSISVEEMNKDLVNTETGEIFSPGFRRNVYDFLGALENNNLRVYERV